MLVRREVGEAIQEGEHNSVDDARAALLVYRKHRSEWEKWIREKRKGKKEEVASGEEIVSWCVCWNVNGYSVFHKNGYIQMSIPCKGIISMSLSCIHQHSTTPS